MLFKNWKLLFEIVYQIPSKYCENTCELKKCENTCKGV